MPDSFAGTAADRPRCRCHDEPMDRVGPRWTCAVARRARQRLHYHAAPEQHNYARARRRLRAQIADKRRRLAEHLEELLEEEDPC